MQTEKNKSELEEFEKFLESKKIRASEFEDSEPEMYREWKTLFYAVHPKSFVAQKLYLINSIRRKYHIDR